MLGLVAVEPSAHAMTWSVPTRPCTSFCMPSALPHSRLSTRGSLVKRLPRHSLRSISSRLHLVVQLSHSAQCWVVTPLHRAVGCSQQLQAGPTGAAGLTQSWTEARAARCRLWPQPVKAVAQVSSSSSNSSSSSIIHQLRGTVTPLPRCLGMSVRSSNSPLQVYRPTAAPSCPGMSSLSICLGRAPMSSPGRCLCTAHRPSIYSTTIGRVGQGRRNCQGSS